MQCNIAIDSYRIYKKIFEIRVVIVWNFWNMENEVKAKYLKIGLNGVFIANFISYY